ncbi:hypothetical protein V565_074280 [Rhizoctonia solani 123E]|uniref:LYC1 C-terminal domain-containing protein n=1 Tax=Rhizoctonia solani 123E TaxID=1423351 RepID=A0A074RV41_9AGAM|nr:hypothetical protein V565_074280 [Rhizoctonia solani 123E]
MSLEHLIIKPATQAQSHEALLQEAGFWGARAGISVEDYVKLGPIFDQGVFARDGRLTVWVLVPEDDPDTVKLYASGHTFTRDVLVLQPGQASPTSSFGHVITSVIVPPEHRGKGYGNRFMSLMHSALAPHRYPNPLKAPTVTDHASTVSVLYSAIGDYYSRCAPSTGESGWTLQKSFITTWQLSNVQIPTGTSPHVKLLFEPDIATTLDSDDSNVTTDLIELQKRDPTKTYFAFVPTAPLNAYSTTIGKLLLSRSPSSSNPSWGAKITDKGDFMTWTYLGLQNLQLIVTRLRATADSFPWLLESALHAAQNAKCESIHVWNVPEDLRDIALATGGETTERTDDLSAFKWYGQQPNSKAGNMDIVWALDERYGWC